MIVILKANSLILHFSACFNKSLTFILMVNIFFILYKQKLNYSLFFQKPISRCTPDFGEWSTVHSRVAAQFRTISPSCGWRRRGGRRRGRGQRLQRYNKWQRQQLRNRQRSQPLTFYQVVRDVCFRLWIKKQSDLIYANKSYTNWAKDFYILYIL